MNEDIASRRLVLRGAFAWGCGLCLPILLSGCDSKPTASNSSMAAPPVAPATPSAPAVSAAPKKLPQVGAQYQAQPKGEQKCSNCIQYQAASNSCKLVDGPISPDGWCAIWGKMG